MVTKTKKVALQEKSVSFSEDGHLINEDGEYVDILHGLRVTFGSVPFDIVASYSKSEKIDVEDLEDELEG